MKSLFFLFTLFLTISCSTNKNVYWCGDHPCINKKEREAYFKETMIVEIKDLENGNYKDVSDIEKVMQQAKLNRNEEIKSEKDLVKYKKLKEKNLKKQLKLEKKRRIKEEKNLAKQIKLEKKRRIKDKKRKSKKKNIVKQKNQLKKNVELDAGVADTKIKLGEFSELFEKITKKNTLRPYPDINDIPN